MPFCPQCRYEYNENIKTCPDCRIPLVSHLSEDHNHDEGVELVALHALPGVIYGEMVKESLEKAGIRCVLKTDVVSTGLLARGALGVGQECQIYVNKKDEKRAENILHAMMDHI
jgi:hypothetical protein